MKPAKKTTKKAPAVKAKTQPVTVDISAVDKLSEDAITTILAQRLLIHTLCDALEEAQK
jgi:hypothetical protein